MIRKHVHGNVIGLFAILFPAMAIAGNGDKYSAPTQFIENKGQITDQHGAIRTDIDVKIEANGVVMFAGGGELHYQWVKTPPATLKGKDVSQATNQLTEQGEVELYRMDVKLVGANKNAEIIFEEPTGYYENYYLAHTGENGVTAKGFQRVIYKDIYPDIDLVFYTPPAPLKGSDISDEGTIANIEYQTSNIKYDFIVHPGGNPADIKLRYEGATDLKLVNGVLIAKTPFGSIAEKAPYSYEKETMREIASAYILSGNELRFNIGSYTSTLVIDPELNWCTYYGGTDWFHAHWTAADTAGNVYFHNHTLSTGNIATAGSHQQLHAGNLDNYIVKFNMAGVRQWATYYGGSGEDQAGGVGADHAGNIYIAGVTNSSAGISTALSYQPVRRHVSDGFIARFNNAGQRVWGTYYGDTTVDGVNDMFADSAGNVYVAGFVDNPAVSTAFGTAGTYGPTSAKGGGYVARFNSSGQRVWGSYCQSAIQITADRYGNVYSVGGTTDTAGIGTPGTFLPSKAPGSGMSPDAFLFKFNPQGQRVWGTYCTEGELDETVWDIACSDSDAIFICGYTASQTGMTSPGAWQTTLKGIGDGFIAAFYGSGQRRWSSYYGGAVNDFLRTIVALPDKKVVAGGGTGSTGMATRHGFQQSLAGPPNGDGLVAMFDSLGQLVWCSYLGGSFTGGNPPSNNGDPIYSSSLCLEKDILYVAGPTISNTGLATPGAYLAVNNVTTGVTVPFIAQIGLNDTLVYIRHSFTDSFACVGDTLRLPYGVTRNFRSNNVFTVQLSNSSGSFSSPTNLKTINSNTADTAVCVIPAGVADGTGYRIRIVATAPVDTSEPNRYDIKIYNTPANFTAGSNSPLCSSDTLKLNSGSTTTGVTYSWAGPVSFSSADDDTIIANTNVGHTGDYYITVNNNGCMVKDTVSVTVDQTPENVTAGNNGPLCSGDTLKLTSSTTTSGVSYTWTGPNNYNTQNVTRPNAQLSDAGTYKVTVTLGSCSDTEVTSVVVNQSPTINIAPLTPVSICTGDTAQFAAFSNNAGTNPQYQWLKNGVAVAGATGTSFKTGSLANGDVISVQLTPNTNCPGTKESNKITMTVQPILSPTVTMTADKMPPWNGGLTVTFTANPTHGGTAPEYQWKRNGADVVGATGTSWGVVVNALNANEDICVVLKSSYECAVPDTALSNCITTAFTGIVGEATNKGFKIYPNPVSGILHIEGVEAGSTIELIDMLGRKCAIAQLLNASMDVSALAPGVYVVRVNGVVAGRVVKE